MIDVSSRVRPTAQRRPFVAAPQTAAPTIGADCVRDFCATVIGTDDRATDRFVHGLLDDGATVESIYIDLLAPAARELGKGWDEDTYDFVAVTVGTGRMQRVVRDLSHLFLCDHAAAEPIGSMLLSCIPGEQHTLGVFLVAEFFIRDGWNVRIGAPLSQTDLSSSVHDAAYDVIGFSVGCDVRVSNLQRSIRRVRRESLNRNIAVLVGGSAFESDPTLAQRVGADGTAADARSAPAAARALLTQIDAC
jgi:methanogenic corrinoid protein MtbC1